jgi:hypothetical protein
MNTRIERTLTGAFRATHLGADTWQLTTGAAGSAEIYLSGVDSDAFAVLDGADAECGRRGMVRGRRHRHADLRPARARNSGRARRRSTSRARSSTRGCRSWFWTLKARRFWRRVFFIARIPGGRRLLRWIAQRTLG